MDKQNSPEENGVGCSYLAKFDMATLSESWIQLAQSWIQLAQSWIQLAQSWIQLLRAGFNLMTLLGLHIVLRATHHNFNIYFSSDYGCKYQVTNLTLMPVALYCHTV